MVAGLRSWPAQDAGDVAQDHADLNRRWPRATCQPLAIPRRVGPEWQGHAVSPQELDFLTGGVFAVLESWMQTGCAGAARPLAQDLAQDMAQDMAQQMRRSMAAPGAGPFAK